MRPIVEQPQSLSRLLSLLLPGSLLVSLLLSLPALAAIPGFEVHHVGSMEPPELRFSYALAEDVGQGVALLFGGNTPTDSWSTLIREYDPATDTWRTLPLTMPYPYVANERHGVARASNGRYYVGPGIGPGGWGQNDQIIEVDLDQGSVIERASLVANGSSIWGVAVAPAPASRGGVYLFGGWNGGGIATIRHYDPVSDQMTIKGALSVARTVGVRVTHPDGRIYLFGGNTSSAATFRAAEVFDPTDESLRALPNPLQLGFNHGTQGWIGSDGMIYLWNPDAPYLGSASSHLVRFDPVSEVFTDLGSLPLDGYGVLASFRNLSTDEVYFFGLVYPGAVWGVFAETAGQVWKLTQGEPPVVDDYRIVFNRGVATASRPWITGLDGQDAAELAEIDLVSLAKIAEGRVVFMAADYQGQGPGIYTMAAVPGAPPSKIPNTENIFNAHGINYDALDISPDGSRVAWAGPEPGDTFQNHNVYVIDLDGSHKMRILRNTSKHFFMINWGESDRIALQVSDVWNAYSQRPYTVRPDGSGLAQRVVDYVQNAHVGGAEGRVVLTSEQAEPRLATLNNAFERLTEVPGPLLGFSQTAWHPSENLVFGSSGGDLYRVAVDSGQTELLVAGGGTPCLGGDVGLGGDGPGFVGQVVDARLDEGSGPLTAAGQGLIGQLIGGTTWTGGQQGSALELDGTGYVEILDDGPESPLDLIDALTLALWIRPDRLGGTQVLISKDDAYELEVGKLGDAVWDLRLNNQVVSVGDSTLSEGLWQHLAVTWDGTTARFYRNGQGDGVASFAGPLHENNENLGLGARPSALASGGSVFHFLGAIDHAQVHARALSAGEIADLFAATVTDIDPPSRFDALPDRVVATSPVMVSLATDEPATCRHDEAPGARYADLGEVFAVTGGQVHSSELEPTAPIGLLAVRCRDALGNVNGDDLEIGLGIGTSELAEGLAASWTFDEATGCETTDQTGNGHDGFLGLDCEGGNAPLWTAGVMGPGLFFDGQDDAVLATASARTRNPAALTLAAWIRLPVSHVWRAVVDVRDAGSDGYNLFVTDASRVFLRVNGSTLTSQSIVGDGSWHLVVGAFDGSVMRIYVDGLLDRELTSGPTTLDVTAPPSLGHHFDGQANYGGFLDTVRLYDRSLSDLEVFDLYLETRP